MLFLRRMNRVAIVCSLFYGTNAGCPFNQEHARHLKHDHTYTSPHAQNRALQGGRTGDGGMPAGGYDAVTKDIIELLTDSQDFFPADFADTVGANYGPLMIRLAWHCSGSYRMTDGRGGCDGGRIRHDPEANWPDNANLDKARKLLEPVKTKYGSDLSWGDLIILAGNAAIESMGGPILGFCGGRIDDIDGSKSLILGPSEMQEKLTPCISDNLQGKCPGNLGPTTVGLIYVNPGGHLEDADPAGLIISDMRSSFGKMGMNDKETLALAGGGHAFGKCHGACENHPCGDGDMTGIGLNTFTSGYEGAWTTVPTTWTNQYFTNLFNFDWNSIKGPGGKIQWEPSLKDGADGNAPNIMMLTSDIALTKDDEFRKISQTFAANITDLEDSFKHAWYKLTTSDMGPATRCLGDNIPPAQKFQSPLPASPNTLPDFIPVRKQIQDLISDKKSNRGAFIDLAYKCASTFRETDYQGGCNGAYVRFDEEKKTKATLNILKDVKDDFPEVSYADIIVLAGQTALEDAGSNVMAFCGGRVDTLVGSDRDLKPIVYDSRLSHSVKIKDAMSVKGLTARQGVALAGMPYTSDDMSNLFFINLIKGHDNGNPDSSFIDEELALVEDPELKSIVKLYALSEEDFLSEFESAWSYLMAADRFNGPRVNACNGVNTPTIDLTTDSGVFYQKNISMVGLLFAFMAAIYHMC